MEDWIEHRRADGERVGWMRPEGEGFVPVDLLGREVSGAVDWLTAEETLDGIGIGYLADLYELRLDDGSWLRVRLAEVSPNRIVAKQDDFGAVGAPQLYYTLPFPLPDTLRPLSR
ncbi:hypothetical protein [Leifsonia aquatica]|uniref:Uncharacterized protein n=2 Tax=Leifsonia aquatica TaxID=144185 RepID=U2TFX8_LEIAQ|nr:hypothetical protein N136_00029 [Leifsonia aquatica ATCC 14665]MBB2965689.1 hypothetical protein [Leifsonia aquatica]